MTKNLNDAGVVLAMHEKERAVVEEATGMVRDVMARTADDGLRWTGTKTDLLELLDVVALKGGIVLEDGRMASFAYLVRMVFPVLHVATISNPRARLMRAKQRKGVRVASVTDRLRLVIENDEERVAFWSRLIAKG